MIAINTINGTKYYGVYDNAGTWTQADAVNLATALAVLDEIPTIAGSYDGTVYEDGETHTPNNTVTVTARPITTGVTTGNIETESDATEGTAVVSVNGVNQFDTEHIDNDDLLDNIMQLYRR